MGMGISTSKMDSSPLLRLCRERKELIRAAADCRYQLAAAHIVYLQSLLDVGNALNHFVEEEMLVLSDCSIESSEENNSDAELISLTESAHDHSEASGCSPSMSSSAAFPAVHEQSGKLDVFSSRFRYGHGESFGTPSRVSPSDVRYDQSNNQVHPLPGDASFSDYGCNVIAAAAIEAFMNNNVCYPQDENWVASGSPVLESPQSFPQFENEVEQDDPYHERTKSVTPAPSTSPTNNIVDWYYLNPFKIIDDINYYSQNYYFSEFNSDQDFREAREREGIPDLEDETVPNSVDISRGEESADTIRESSVTGTSQASISQEKEKSDPITIQEDGEDTVTQDGESLESSSLTTLDDCVSKNITEIVKEIGDIFETVVNYGKEVAVFFEAGKLPYQPMGAKLKEVASRIFGFTPLQLNQLAPRTMMMDKAINGDVEDISRKFGDLSSTLEQLFAWEKKLYAEVLGEEKLRVIYDKKYNQQKLLDDKGAEYSKIDDIHVSLRRLLSKINVAVTAVDVISRRIHRLRDEDLLAQLKELIEGLLRMWDFMVKCHRKQFRTIIGTKAYVHMANADSRKSSNMKATQRLEKEMLNWGSSFRDYASTQKAFVKFLNEWLLRCIFQEPEATPDGKLTFSLSSIGAPPVFIICSDWYNAIEEVSDSGVYEAIHSFASSLHQLWEKQNEEQHERQKAMHLSKDFEKLLRIIHEESGLQWHQDALLNHLSASEFPAESVAQAGGLDVDLVSMNKRLEEQKARHEEVVRQLNDAASSCLQDGLVPIFEALEKFCWENLKAYKQIRFLNRQ
ncbi:uncharacterized protein LOC110410061 isoform X2 [Herrania umbratica]|uniref:Uncharacterized protein LOC110410061 isoform X2 n=1 Tax=Herrania umbratica TaxID=108875 RepID=A0A6J0ZKL5_9ROSI|nr:uncharacterized protein LOC110410061 isoform X2 [Herrania umbratica]